MIDETVLFEAAKAAASSAGFAPSFSTRKSRAAAAPQAVTPAFLTSLRRLNVFEIGELIVVTMLANGPNPAYPVEGKPVGPVSCLLACWAQRTDNRPPADLLDLLAGCSREITMLPTSVRRPRIPVHGARDAVTSGPFGFAIFPGGSDVAFPDKAAH